FNRENIQIADPDLIPSFEVDLAAGQTLEVAVKAFDESDSHGGGAVWLLVSTYIPGWLDMNPAHIVRECLTDTNWGMGYASGDMGDSFYTAADTLHLE